MRLKKITHGIRWKGIAIGKPTINVEVQQDGKETKAEDILKEIRQVKACSRIVFTGMDPLIDQMDILEIIGQVQEGWEIIIETTGGVMPDLHLRERVTAWEVNIPKEGTAVPFQYNDDAIRFYGTQKNAVFEWSVRGEQDLIEVKKTVFQYNLPWKRVILSPDHEWLDDPKELLNQFEWLEKFCLEKGASIGNPVVLNKKGKEKEDANDQRDTGLPVQDSKV